MFPGNYFAPRYYAPRYFPPTGIIVIIVPPPGRDKAIGGSGGGATAEWKRIQDENELIEILAIIIASGVLEE